MVHGGNTKHEAHPYRHARWKGDWQGQGGLRLWRRLGSAILHVVGNKESTTRMARETMRRPRNTHANLVAYVQRQRANVSRPLDVRCQGSALRGARAMRQLWRVRRSRRPVPASTALLAFAATGGRSLHIGSGGWERQRGAYGDVLRTLPRVGECVVRGCTCT